MWEIYDELIEMVPDDLIVTDFLAGLRWFLVRTNGVGMAMTPREGSGLVNVSTRIKGMNARDVARFIKSWDNHEAAMGLAAINSFINQKSKIESLNDVIADMSSQVNLFDYMKDEIRGKNVAVIGHFRGLETIAEICNLHILERFPQPGDYPDPACEYILPEQEYVFITGTTLINKTLPRLLELSRNAKVSVVGPSTPMTPVLFKYGINTLAGTMVVDDNAVWNLIQEGDQHRFFSEGGQMVKISKK